MLNFGGFLTSNFWNNYRCTTSPTIEELLNNKECSVDKLLDDEDCLQEFKNYNDKLIKWFDHDKVKVLIDYITIMPEPDANYQRGRKYPFLSGEIFNCEINQMLDKFFEAPVKVVQDKDGEGDFDEDDDIEDKDSKGSKEAATDSDEEKKSSEEKDEKDEKAEEPSAAAKDLEEAADEAGDKTDSTDKSSNKDEEDKEEAKEPKEKQGDGEQQVNPQNDEAEAEEKKEDATVAEKKEEPVAAAKEPDQKNAQEPEAEEQADAKVEEEKKSAEKDEKEPAEELKESEKKEADIKKEDDAKKVEPEEEEPAKLSSEAEPVVEKDDEKKEDDKKEESKEDELETVASTIITESNVDDAEEDDEADNKWVLLERLFKFIRKEPGETEDEQLNPVLAGYFCKLVSLLISRKQKQLMPFIFSPESDIMDYLLKHVYQRSISEILGKLLTQIDSDYEPELQAQIKQKQLEAVSKLIELLGPQVCAESNLNACTIIQDLYETKEYYNIILMQENIEKIVNYSTTAMDSGTKASKSTSLQVLNQIIANHIEKAKKKDKSGDLEKADLDEDDVTVQPNSDDEKDDLADGSTSASVAAQGQVLIDAIARKVNAIEEVLATGHEGERIASSVCEAQYVPLGPQRLHTVELVYKLVCMRKESVYELLKDSKVFARILELVKVYAWNNFLQLKVINLFEEILNNCDVADFKKSVLVSSGVGQAIVDMGASASYQMGSEKQIRNGYMAVVVDISNKLVKRTEQVGAAGSDTTGKAMNEDLTVIDYLDGVAGWKEFVDGELDKSNKKNKRTLGGTTRAPDEDANEDDTGYDVQMDKIMARFNSFDQILSQNPAQDDDDDDDEDDPTHDDDGKKDNWDEDDDDQRKDDDSDDRGSISNAPNGGVVIQKVEVNAPAEITSDFADNNFWKVDNEPSEDDIDALLAELEA